MKTTIKIIKYVIIVLIIILLGVIIYNVAIKENINPTSKNGTELTEQEKKRIKEYKELLQKNYNEEETEFVYVKENKTTITFKKQKVSDKSLVANYVIDKKTKSVTEEKQKGVPNSGE